MSQPTLVTRKTPVPAGWRYSVMRKLVMALSGLALVAFLFGHWAGNTVMLEGEVAFDEYMAWLGKHPLLHYSVYIVIITALLAHLAVGPHHWWFNRRARPVRYHRKQHVASSWTARSMMVSGTLLLLFLIVHTAHIRGWLAFTDTGSLYRNLHAGFMNYPLVAVYLLGQLALAVHLYHGMWSQFQTLGIDHPRYNHWRRPIAVFIAIGIALLNIILVLLAMDDVQRLLEKFS